MNNHGFSKQLIYNCTSGVFFSTYNMFALNFSVNGIERTIEFAAPDFFRGIGDA